MPEHHPGSRHTIGGRDDQFVALEHETIAFPNDAIDDDGNPIPVEIISGAGRFEDAEGTLFSINGTFGPEGSTWELVGTTTYWFSFEE